MSACWITATATVAASALITLCSAIGSGTWLITDKGSTGLFRQCSNGKCSPMKSTADYQVLAVWFLLFSLLCLLVEDAYLVFKRFKQSRNFRITKSKQIYITWCYYAATTFIVVGCSCYASLDKKLDVEYNYGWGFVFGWIAAFLTALTPILAFFAYRNDN